MSDRISRIANRLAIAVLFTSLLTFAGCGSKPNKTSSKLNVVTTVGMVADLVRQVGGDEVEVIQICGAGVDPHLYKPTRDDVLRIRAADIVFYSGLKLEGKMVDTLEKVGKSKPVFAITDTIDRSELLSGDATETSSDSAHADPHLWNDVSLWSQCVPLIAEQLGKLRPEAAEKFNAAADTYQTQLAELHQYGKDVTASIPEQSRLLITSHDAFSYFGRAYGLEVQGIQGISTESEAGLRRINELVDLLIDRKVTSVFIESSVRPKNVEALIEGASQRGHEVETGGVLYSDAMGSEGTYEGTYVGMLDHNLTTTAKALGGVVPEGGFQGKLSGKTDSH
ncbi:metal ABC transporter solute-binding protein, Zn/Mn family [Rhodopirellula sp. MGV]|uniref:metal ABC transporter solute-binding protein, Zn/Mn family n=1 Tax=Rhodopirellula sp. MGV TaxID=2023130 RepID=UPI000B978C78|nr:zinc ABC transporter substrate-binding protein [Rhodopirellula sp. MGV]OYP37377.1 manganese transporter [Rhodopirellula sp. MGV]PNY38036.1 manganese transporter [Rhodopirellula baltica]